MDLLKRQLLLMKYDMKSTLTENVQNVLNEDGIVNQALRTGKVGVEDLSSVLTNMRQDQGIAKALDDIRFDFGGSGREGVKTAEDLSNLLRSGKTLTPELIGGLEMGILKSAGIDNKALIDAAASDLVTSNEFLTNYPKELRTNQVEFTRQLQSKGYSQEAISSIQKQIPELGGKVKSVDDLKQTKVSSSKSVSTAKEAEDIAKVETMTKVDDVSTLSTQKGKWEGFGKFARQKGLKTLEYLKKLGWKRVLAYGIGGWLLIYLWRNWFSNKPKQWSQCLIDYVGYENFKPNRIFDQGGGVLSFLVGKTGVPSLDLAGQLYLRNDGTAKNGDFEGTWECNGNVLTVEFNGEEYSLKKEVKPKKVEKPKKEKSGDGTITPTPIRKSQFTECTGTYKQNCKSEVIRKAQGCLGITADGLFGPETKGAVVARLGKSSFTDADVNTICGTTTQTTQKVSPTPVQEPEELGSGTTNINDFMTGI